MPRRIRLHAGNFASHARFLHVPRLVKVEIASTFDVFRFSSGVYIIHCRWYDEEDWDLPRASTITSCTMRARGICRPPCDWALWRTGSEPFSSAGCRWWLPAFSDTMTATTFVAVSRPLPNLVFQVQRPLNRTWESSTRPLLHGCQSLDQCSTKLVLSVAGCQLRQLAQQTQ
jgi:hypothetical protein